MKLKHLSILFFFVVVNAYSQSATTLKSAMQQLYEANYLMDFETIAQLSYPNMVEKTGKEAFLEQTEQFYENDTYRQRYQLQTVPFQFGPITKIGNQWFCVVTVRIPKRYFFEEKLTEEKAAEKRTWLQRVNQTKDVIFEPNRNSFNVKMIATFIAVYNENTNGNWRFFNFDFTEQKTTFEQLFDETVIKQLKL
ncbi:MAG: hypothetical protein CUR32_04235 [Flavobacterium sp.]|jgi:hypothetical protein|nr:MAG: hypothetical protein CUR32_04235 [Flavobacterium sp.] [Flavobacterium sp. FEMGT703F]